MPMKGNIHLRAFELLILIATFRICSCQKSLQLPGGRRTPCYNEGESVAVDDIDKRGCFSCICKNGFVECRSEYTCPPKEGCYMLMEKTDDVCCQKCKGCVYKGIRYDSHTEWTDPSDSCVVMRCEAGIVTESRMQCHTPCMNPLPPAPGTCCPTCSECNINGQIATDDRDVTTSDDPCMECRCVDGRLACTKKACPVLQCPEEHQFLSSGECCSKCAGARMLLTVANTCTVGNSFYLEGHKFNTDRCTHCSCSNGTAVCRRHSCPVLNCAPTFQEQTPGDCCPHCATPAEIRTQCSYMGQVYEDGHSWKLNACSSCKCVQGMPSCARTRCNVTMSCPPGSTYMQTDNECCGRCVENEGVCMAFGNSHYKTFDGKIYNFAGLGKYQFVSDCRYHSFSIRVTNVQQKKLGNNRRVSIKTNKIRINLSQSFRCKVNGDLVKLPFKIEGLVKIEKKTDILEVTLSNKVVVLWNGKSFLEVTVPPEFKNNLCGLCGNFNSNIKDDFKLRKGIVVRDSSVAAFASSWCVGTKTSCMKQAIQSTNIHPCKRRNTERNHCKHLLSTDVFNGCDSKLNYNKYYNACKMDMCDCPNGKCYCESLMAYSRECGRLGVDVENWKKDSYCTNTNKGRRKKPISNSKFSQEYISKLLMGINKQNRTKSGRSPIPLN